MQPAISVLRSSRALTSWPGRAQVDLGLYRRASSSGIPASRTASTTTTAQSQQGRSSPRLAGPSPLASPREPSIELESASSDAHLPDDDSKQLPSPITASQPPPARRRAVLVALIVLSTASAYTLPSGALQNRRLASAIPVIQYALLLAVGLALGCLQPKGKFGRARVGREDARVRLLVGGLSAACALAGVWQARWVEGRVWQAIEVSPPCSEGVVRR